MRVEVLEPAERDLEDIFAYYESQKVGLGDRFLREFQRSALFIADFPRSYARIFRAVRVCPLRRFPYGIFYRISKGVIYIKAIFHLHRGPSYWKRRL